MGGVVFVVLCRPGLLSPKGKVLGDAFGGAGVGHTLYTKEETFGKGVLRHCTVLVSMRRDVAVTGTWYVSLGVRGLFREEQLLRQDFSPEAYPPVLPEGSTFCQQASREALSRSLGLVPWARVGCGRR